MTRGTDVICFAGGDFSDIEKRMEIEENVKRARTYMVMTIPSPVCK